MAYGSNTSLMQKGLSDLRSLNLRLIGSHSKLKTVKSMKTTNGTKEIKEKYVNKLFEEAKSGEVASGGV